MLARARPLLAIASLALSPLLACRADRPAPTTNGVPNPAAPPSADASGIPSMPYDRFLSGYPDEARRHRLWDDFRDAEREAKTFAASPDRWVVLTEVVVGTSGARWHTSGSISLAPESPPGTLFHEIFHTAFHKSVFHQGKDRGWGEPWCDAFRYVTESTIVVPPSGWVGKVHRYMSMTFDEVMAKSGDREHDKHYAYPASLILKKTDGTAKGLRRFWFDLVAEREKKGDDILDAFFGYSMEERRPL